jgi:hypothetical protein
MLWKISNIHFVAYCSDTKFYYCNLLKITVNVTFAIDYQNQNFLMCSIYRYIHLDKL